MKLKALEAMTQSLKSFVLATAIMHQQLSSSKQNKNHCDG